MKREVLIEGLTPSELLELPELEELVVGVQTIVFRIGSAEVLAEFSAVDRALQVELAVVEDGGEGVLPVLVDLIERASRRHRYSTIEWVVYARNCATPNKKLERVLSKLGFEIRLEPLEHYHRRSSANESLLARRRGK